MPTTHEQHLQDLREIRSLMERSSRFIGLSGLSGVAAGCCALVGAAVAYYYLDVSPFQYPHIEAAEYNDLPTNSTQNIDNQFYYERALTANKWGMHYRTFLPLLGLATALAAIGFGILFTTRRAKQKGQSIWDASARRLLMSLVVPLATGGLFGLALLQQGALSYIAPTTLIFYGLALVNGSKYTLSDVYYLGLTEIALGILAMFLLKYGLEFWVIGFGFLHIFYGLLMYYRYERVEK
jgi:hypothetical protein